MHDVGCFYTQFSYLFEHISAIQHEGTIYCPKLQCSSHQRSNAVSACSAHSSDWELQTHTMCTTSNPTVILEPTATSRNVIPVFQVSPGAWALGCLSAALAISLLFLYPWRFPWWRLAFPMGRLMATPGCRCRNKLSLRGHRELPLGDSEASLEFAV